MNFRIFLSSTFSDFQAERNALQNVWAKLKTLCNSRGASFQVVDLRWGISPDAVHAHDAIQICLDEVKRCQKLSPRPNFLMLIGDRYGWRPPAITIPDADFVQIIKAVPENDAAFFSSWYRRDENSVPPAWCLKPREGEWGSVENRLVAIQHAAAKKLGLSPAHYLYSATHMEIVTGLLNLIGLKDHIFSFNRQLNGLPDLASKGTVLRFSDYLPDNTHDTETKALLETLKGQIAEAVTESQINCFQADWLGDESTPISTRHLEKLCKDVEQSLLNVIKPELERKTATSPLEIELEGQLHFLHEAGRLLIGRDQELIEIEKYLSNPKVSHPLIIQATSGCGKSSLMAKAIIKHEEEGKIFIYRFIGATPRSWQPLTFLEDLIMQIANTYGKQPPDLPEERKIKTLAELFHKQLDLASEEQPLTIFIDAIDQFSSTAPEQYSDLFPEQLPDNVKMVISVLEGEDPEQLVRLYPKSPRIIPKLLNDISCGKILDALISPRILTNEQRAAFLEKAKVSGLPLWLTLVAPIARKLHSWETAPDLPTDIKELACYVIKRIGDKHGNAITTASLRYIKLSRFGISETELQEILWRDPEVRAEFDKNKHPDQPEVNALPPIFWSRLYAEFDPYINECWMDGQLLYHFFHRVFGEVADGMEEETRKILHGRLADYFSEQPLYLSPCLHGESQGDGGIHQPNSRKLMELPYHLALAGRIDEARALITDFDFAMAKCRLNRSDDWANDFRLASTGERTREYRIWEEFVRTKANILRRGNADWPGHKILLQLAMEHADDSPITIAAENWALESTDNWLWLKAAYRPPQMKPNFHVFSIDDPEEIHYLQLSPDKEYILASCGNTIKSFDLETGRLLMCYDGHEGPVTGIRWINQESFISWSKDETVILWKALCSTAKKRIDGINRPFYSASCNSYGEILLWSGEVDRIERYGDYRALWEYGPIQRSHFASSVRIKSICEKVNRLSLSLPFKVSGIDTLNRLIEMPNLYDMLSEKLGVNILSTMGLSLMSEYHFNKEEMPPHLGNKDNTKGNLRRFNRNLLLSTVTPDTNKSFILWDTVKEQRQLFQGHEGEVLGADFVGGKEIVSWSTDETIRIWDKDTAKCVAVITELGAMVSHLEIIPGGRAVVCDLHGFLSLWDIPGRKCLSRKKSYHEELCVEAVRFRMIDDNTLLAWTRDEIQIWSIMHRSLLGDELEKIAAISNQFTSPFPDLIETVLKLPNDIIVWIGAGNIYLWDYQKNTLDTLSDALSSLSDHVVIVGLRHVADNIIVLWSNNHTLAVFDLDARELLKVFPQGTSPIMGVYALDRQRLAINDGKIRVYEYGEKDVSTCTEGTIQLLNDPYCYMLPKQESYLLIQRNITNNYDYRYKPVSTIQYWDLTGRCLNQFTVNHNFEDSHMDCLILDNTHVLTSECLKEVKVWEISTGRCVCDLTEKIKSLSDLENILKFTGLYTNNSYDYKFKIDRSLGPFSLDYNFSGYRIGPNTIRWEDDSTIIKCHGLADLCTIVSSRGVLHLYNGRDRLPPLQFLENYLVNCRRDGENLEWCLEQIGDSHYKAKEFASALEAYRDLLDCCKNIDQLGSVICKLGATLMADWDLDEALQMYQEAARLATDDIGHAGENMVTAYMGQVITLLKLGRMEEALEASDKLLQDGKRWCCSGVEWGRAMLQRSAIFYNLEKYQDAKDNVYKAIRIFSEENHVRGMMAAYMQLGEIFSTEGNISDTVAALKKAVEYGLTNIEKFLSKLCFDSLRLQPEYSELLSAKRPWLQ